MTSGSDVPGHPVADHCVADHHAAGHHAADHHAAGHHAADHCVADRRRAAALAGFHGAADTAEAARTDPDPKVRIAALRSLARLGTVNEHRLSQALDDPEPAVRIAALEIAVGHTSLALERLLEDHDPMVVESAAWALGERQAADDATIGSLSQVARHHQDPLARESAVAALGAIGDERGLPAILAATHDKVAVRRRAVIALAPFEGAEVTRAYDRARRDRDRQVRDAVDEMRGPNVSGGESGD